MLNTKHIPVRFKSRIILHLWYINGFIKPKTIINENGESEAPEINPNQEVQIVNNYLEKSNVNPVEELILTLEHQRNYETHVKFIDLAKQMDEGGASLMRVPE